jgi:hypothetical protein
MNRPRLVREVYSEMRRALAGRASPREILESAAALVELFTQPEDDGPQFDLRTGGVPFGQWALDVAFADGGWRVMGYETRLHENLLEEEVHERWLHNGMARMATELQA